MYDVSSQVVDEGMINIHYYYYFAACPSQPCVCVCVCLGGGGLCECAFIDIVCVRSSMCVGVCARACICARFYVRVFLPCQFCMKMFVNFRVLYACILLICIIMGMCAVYVFL